MNLSAQQSQLMGTTRLSVILWHNDGRSPEELAKVLRLSLGTVYNYLNAYIGEEKIKHGPRGGSKSELSQEQRASLVKHLQEYTYSKGYKCICKQELWNQLL